MCRYPYEDLKMLVIEYLLEDKGEQGGCILCFDSSQVARGFHAVACEERFYKEFLDSCVAKFSGAWEGVKLKVILYDEIPRSLAGRHCRYWKWRIIKCGSESGRQSILLCKTGVRIGSNLLKKMKINDATGTDKPPLRRDHIEGSADKSAEFEVQLNLSASLPSREGHGSHNNARTLDRMRPNQPRAIK